MLFFIEKTGICTKTIKEVIINNEKLKTFCNSKGHNLVSENTHKTG